MIIEEQDTIAYEGEMLSEVDYRRFNDSDTLVSLEYGTMKNCQAYLEELEQVLNEYALIQTPTFIVMHLGFYLGSMLTVCCFENQTDPDNHAVTDLIKRQANIAYQLFSKHPINCATQAEKNANLAELRKKSPGSILPQTIRLSSYIMQLLSRLVNYRLRKLGASPPKQTEFTCPPQALCRFLINMAITQRHEWESVLTGHSTHTIVNQLAIQIGWLIGYFSHLDKCSPEKSEYFDYGLPGIAMYRSHIHQAILMIHQQEKSNREKKEERADQAMEALMEEIYTLSSKTHAAVPPPVTQLQKEAVIAQADFEKLIMTLFMEGMSVKIVYMSLFYFWFTLELPLQKIPLEQIEQCEVLMEIGSIVQLIQSTVRPLPDPDLSEELKALNAKMQAIKAHLPHPSTLDNVPQEDVMTQTPRVNTAIHGLMVKYLDKDYHPEIIANVMFNQWLRLSVFYGVTESEWQKMDYYLGDILANVRHYIPTIFNR